MSRIAILGGTGALGGALAANLAKAGHEIWIGSRDPEKARVAAAALAEARPGASFFSGDLEACAQGADLCILTVPYAAHAETLTRVKDRLSGKILIDTTVPLRPPRLGTVQLPPSGSAAVDAQALLGPGVRVVSALQNVSAPKLAAGQAVDCDVLVAADDAEAAAAVCDLLKEIGLRAWHVGPLANSAAAEALTSVLIFMNRHYKSPGAGIRITGLPDRAADAD